MVMILYECKELFINEQFANLNFAERRFFCILMHPAYPFINIKVKRGFFFTKVQFGVSNAYDTCSGNTADGVAG